MNCPYCHKAINAFTGFQEAEKFEMHLRTCRKDPANIVIRDGRRVVVASPNRDLLDALQIRAEAGQ